MELLWYITPPDGRYPWNPEGARRVDYPYLQTLARTVETAGFSGALFATAAAGGNDVWVTAASLIPHTERMRFLIAVHPSLLSPALLVKQATTFDQFSKGRLLINVVNGDGGFPAAGVHLDHDQRYAHSDEFLTIYRRVMSGEVVDFEGEHLQVEGTRVVERSLQRPYPPLWFGGSSEPALEVAAKHIDTYLTWGEPLEQAEKKILDLRRRAALYGRELRFGIRLYVIVRETAEEAWAVADNFLRHMNPDHVAAMQRALASGDSVGQRNMLALHGGTIPKHARELEIAPDLWAGFGLVRPGPGTAIVGDPETVAKRLLEYRDIGIESFIISNVPLIEEALRISDLLMPLLPLDEPPVPDTFAGPRKPHTFNSHLNGLGAT